MQLNLNCLNSQPLTNLQFASNSQFVNLQFTFNIQSFLNSQLINSQFLSIIKHAKILILNLLLLFSKLIQILISMLIWIKIYNSINKI